MDTVFIIISILLMLLSFIGCVLPLLPGPPLALAALVLFKFTEYGSGISVTWICIFAVLTLLVTVLDYIVPAWGAKKFGGSAAGVWGSVIGIIIGLFFLPFGIIAGPFLGAFIGELIAGKSYKKSFKAAFGTFVGFLFGTGIKFIVCVWMAVYCLYIAF